MTERTSAELCEELKRLIDDTQHHNEEECKEYLKYVPGLFIRDSFRDNRNILRIKTEYRHHTGDSDYIISANVSANGIGCARAYVWEIKAPQCFVFRKTNENRAEPSPDLIQAETQLLHYYDDLKHQTKYLFEEFKVPLAEDLCFGGIIIGCNRTKVERAENETEMNTLFNRAIRCRNYFYEHAKGTIKLMLWDEILPFLSGGEYIHTEHKRVEAASPYEAPRISPDTISVFGDEKASLTTE